MRTQIADLVEEVKQAKIRRDFMLSFANDTVGFIQRWIVSQHRDLKVGRAEHGLCRRTVMPLPK